MVRRSLIVTVLAAVSSPLAAQEEFVWTSDRPDADAPLGVVGARTLDLGEFEIGYRFSQFNSQGLWFMTDSIPLADRDTLGYAVLPRSLSQQTHTATFAWGLLDRVTLIGTAEFSIFEREQSSSDAFFITRVEALGDVTAAALFDVYRQGPYRGNISLGAVIPTGKSRTYADTPFGENEAQPYDARPGGGALGVTPGASFQVQNEFGSLGGQFRARINVSEGSAEWTPGDRYEANGWAAYKLNGALSVSAGIRWAMWGRIEGGDPLLDSERDPGNDPVYGMAGGQRADMPLGVNLLMPEGSPLAGHRFALEAVYAMHHDYEGVRLGLDWGINIGWTASVDLF